MDLIGPGDGILDLQWHPNRPLIASVSTKGIVYIWGCPPQENWSAFAPDFVELEENRTYDEREDEFDVIDYDKKDANVVPTHVPDDEVIDITTVPVDMYVKSV